MIVSYGNEGTRDVHYDDNTKAARAIPRNIWPVARRKLNQINAAADLADLKSPGNKLERLKGNLVGFFSIRINDQWRIIFKFENGQAIGVEIIDYH